MKNDNLKSTYTLDNIIKLNDKACILENIS